ncbi:hypothetical protein Droror1_Dr00005208 [Drosera rotundifolia]
MGCSLSSRDQSNEAVSLCRERKRLMKMAIEHRQTFSDSHSNYTRSLSSISSALRLLIARFHDDKPIFEESETADHDDEEERSGTEEEEDQGVVCEYFYEDKKQPPPPPPMPEPERGIMGWDFFGLFDHHSTIETMCLIDQGRDVDEEDRSGDENHGRDHHHHHLEKEVVLKEKVSVKEESGKGLMEALREVEEQFARVCEGGFGVSRMLEVNQGRLGHETSYLGEIKEISSNLMNSISCHQTASTQSSPCKSLLSNSSATSSTLSDCRSDVFDGCGGMRAGSHSFTLGRLYAWEKKLFDEVKAGQKCSKSYQKKWAQLNRQGNGEDLEARDKDEVTGLYTKVLVTRRSAESIYKQIEKLRDEELLPQILELLDGLMRTWKMMMESHEIQARTMRLMKSSSCHDYSKFYCEWNGILELESKLQTWHASFSEYMSSQKAYIKTLHGWLSMFVGTESEMYSNGKDLVPKGVQPLLATCHKWLDSLETLPEKSVKNAIRDLTTDVRSLRARQGEEQRLLRRVDGLAKEIDMRSVGYLSETKDYRDQLIKKLELEKTKHQDTKMETQRATFNTLKMGFSSVFDAMVDFSKASVESYADLLAYHETAKDRSYETDDRLVERQGPSALPS